MFACCMQYMTQVVMKTQHCAKDLGKRRQTRYFHLVMDLTNRSAVECVSSHFHVPSDGRVI